MEKHPLYNKFKSALMAVLIAVVSLPIPALTTVQSAYADDDTYKMLSVVWGDDVSDASNKPSGTALMNIVKSGNNSVIMTRTYCIQRSVSVSPGQDGYEMTDWETSGIQNLGQVTWVLNHSYPKVSLADLRSEIDANTLTEKNAIAMTQAAIWYFTDGFRLKEGSVGTASQKLYDYLTSNAVDELEPNIALPEISVPSINFLEDVPFGPVTVTSVDGADIKLEVDGSPVTLTYDDDQTAVDLNAVKSGRAFSVKPTDLENPGSVTFKVSGKAIVPAGMVFKHPTKIVQTLIAATVFEKVASDSKKMDWKKVERTKREVEKKWVGKKAESVEIILYGDNKEVARQTITAEDGWKYTFTNLREYDKNGKEIVYTIDETNLGERYEKEINGLVITNTYLPETGSVTGIKQWVGGEALGDRPTIWLKLYRQISGGEVEAVPDDDAKIKELTNGNLTATWDNLEQTDIDGNKYTFSVKEVDAAGADFTPANYTKNDEQGLTVVNTFKSPTEDITALKKWVGGSSLVKPKITLKLMRKSSQMAIAEEVGSCVLKNSDINLVSGESQASCTWKDLPVYDQQGNKFDYSVDEIIDGQPGLYVPGFSGLVVTNTYKSPQTKVNVKKVWQGGKDRPSVTVHLLQDGKRMNPDRKVVLSARNNWRATFDKLDRTDAEGNPYKYTVEEEKVDNYKPSYSADCGGLIITNKYIIPTNGKAKAVKFWVGGEALGQRPTVYFKLYRQIAGGQKEAVPGAEVKRLANGTTQVSWTKLEETDKNGNKYTFSVKEVDSRGRDFTPAGYVKKEDGLKVANTYQIPKTIVKAKKDWQGGSALGDRPTVYFKLYRQIAGGRKEAVPGAEVKRLPNGTTQVMWGRIDKTDKQGRLYIFSVKEVDFRGRDFTPAGYVKKEDGLKVTNTYQIPKTSIEAEKVWVGGEALGDRLEVEFQLYRNGEAFGEPVAVKDGQVEWNELDETDFEGNPYEYTVDEVNVPENYEKSIDGNIITNTYKSPVTDFSVTKVWKGRIPEVAEIEVALMRNGKQLETVKLTTFNSWKYEWKDIDLTDEDGNPYIYTVKELTKLSHYTTKVEGDIEEGFVITNTYFTPGKGGVPPVSAAPNTGVGTNNSWLGMISLIITLAGVALFERSRKNA